MKMAIVASFVTVLVVMLFVFAFYRYPVPSGDTFFFFEPAVHYAKDGSLHSYLFINKADLNTKIDLSGEERFLWYPPLFPMVVGSFIRADSPEDIFIVIAFINSLVLIIASVIFWKVANNCAGNGARLGCDVITREKNEMVISWPAVILILIGLMFLVTSFDIGTGRPETLVKLWLTVGLFVFLFYDKGTRQQILLGVIIGLVFVTHPLAGVISCFLLSTFWSFVCVTRELIKRLGLVGLSGIATGLLVFCLGPYGIIETIRGTLGNALSVNEGVSLQLESLQTLENIVNHYFLSQAAPFYGLVIVLIVSFAVLFFRQEKSLLKSRIIFVISILVLMFVFGKVLYTVTHIFYFSLFTPICAVVLINAFCQYGKLWKFLVAVTFIFASTGILRTALLFPYFVADSVSFGDMKVAVGEALFKADLKVGERLGLTSGFWMFGENFKRVDILSYGETPRGDVGVIIHQQRYTNKLLPPDITGCVMKVDMFSREVPKLLGFSVASTMPGYAYAVYECGARQ